MVSSESRILQWFHFLFFQNSPVSSKRKGRELLVRRRISMKSPYLLKHLEGFATSMASRIFLFLTSTLWLTPQKRGTPSGCFWRQAVTHYSLKLFWEDSKNKFVLKTFEFAQRPDKIMTRFPDNDTKLQHNFYIRVWELWQMAGSKSTIDAIKVWSICHLSKLSTFSTFKFSFVN